MFLDPCDENEETLYRPRLGSSLPMSSLKLKRNVRAKTNTSKDRTQLQDFEILNSLNQKPANDRKRRHDDGQGNGSVKKKKKTATSNENFNSSIQQQVLTPGLDRRRKNEEILASSENIDIEEARKIIKLFDEGNTIPFLARYRKNLIHDMDSLKLRKIKCTYEYIKKVNEKADQAIQSLTQKHSVSQALIDSILIAESPEEIDFLVAPFKKEKQLLAQKAKELNLEKPALQILEGKSIVSLEKFIRQDGLEDVKKVKQGIQHIISDIICKDADVQQILNKITQARTLKIHTKEKKKKLETKKKLDSSKYEMYKDFTQYVTHLQSYHILAICRGEAEGILSVKIEIPAKEWEQISQYAQKKWLKNVSHHEPSQTIIKDSIKYSISNLLSRVAERRVRSRLKKKAQEEAVTVFESNLKQLLLTPPCKGVVIMGIDPGFRNGCKVAVISQQGVPLTWTKFYLPNKVDLTNESSSACVKQLKNLVLTYKCEVIALGNGKGCRETEVLLSRLIETKSFHPINVSYTIISEQGVSIYSCSPEAAKEFPDLDPMFVGAVSLARRLQDPLSELVKVEPKHLGIGLYQHDVKSSLLSNALNEIVSECVSFVGVDLNTATLYLLKRVAGLNESKALEILKYRNEKCEFRMVEELKKVKGIGPKTFRQCAGFFRIVTCSPEVKINPLDQTIIHPESYETATGVAKKLKLDLSKLGKDDFIHDVKSKLVKLDVNNMAATFEVPSTDIALILDAFTKPVNHDIRNSNFGPAFRKNVTNIESLRIGQILTGVVQNVVPFGAFVDIGITIHGLIHSSKMNRKTVVLHDKVNVEVLSIDLDRKRVGLELKDKLNEC